MVTGYYLLVIEKGDYGSVESDRQRLFMPYNQSSLHHNNRIWAQFAYRTS